VRREVTLLKAGGRGEIIYVCSRSVCVTIVQLDMRNSFSCFIYLVSPQDKRLNISLNGNRKIIGTLRGYDAFLNVVIEDAEGDGGAYLGQIVVRGNSIVQFEALERIY